MGAAICMKLSCLPCMHVCACMDMHVHMYGAPPTTPDIHPLTRPPPELQGAQNTKIQ